MLRRRTEHSRCGVQGSCQVTSARPVGARPSAGNEPTVQPEGTRPVGSGVRLAPRSEAPTSRSVGGLGGGVGHPGGVPVRDRVAPAPEGTSEPVDLGAHAGILEILGELSHGRRAHLGVGDAIDAPEGLFGVRGVADLAVGILGIEQARSRAGRCRVRELDLSAHQVQLALRVQVAHA